MTLNEWFTLAEISCHNARPGPWKITGSYINYDLYVGYPNSEHVCVVPLMPDGSQVSNAQFIADSRVNLPTALKIIRAWNKALILVVSIPEFTRLARIAEEIINEEKQ